MKHPCLAALASMLVLSACEPKKVATALKPPPERLQCVPAGERPKVPAEHVIDWPRLRTLAEAKAEHDLYVRSVRARELVVANYIVEIEGRLFKCSNDAAWLREWYAALPD